MLAVCKNLLLEVILGDECLSAQAATYPRYARRLHSSSGTRSAWAGMRPVLGGEEGMITWATLIAVVLFCALIAIVFNVGRVANDKLEAQNAADSAAYSASLVQARAMNALTASNHMMGELTALYTMHHAIGGKVLDEGGTKNNYVVFGLNLALQGAYALAWGESLLTLWVGGTTPVSPGSTTDVPRGEATVYDAKCLLKEQMIEQYALHMKGSTDILEGIATAWFFGAGLALIEAGIAQQQAANMMIRKLKQEYEFIILLEDFAIGSRSIKKDIIPGILSALWVYEQTIAGDIAPGLGAELQVARAAKTAAEKNKCVGEVVGRPELSVAAAMGHSGRLPIEKDGTTKIERTQLMRATYPWIQEWRWPVLLAFDGVATLSRAARFYEYHSDRYAKETCQKFRDERGFKLYVMQKMNATNSGTDKGTESWRKRQNTEEADKLFCVVGFARKVKGTALTHNHIMPNTNAKPIAALSQAMIYNSNRPKKWESKGLDIMFWLLNRKGQPVEGWDTLNWTEGATEWKEGKPYFNLLPMDWHWTLGKLLAMDAPFVYPPDVKIPPVPSMDAIAGPPTPKVVLNWQAKLVPLAPKTLRTRVLMIHDSKIRERMHSLLPVLWAPAVYPDVFNH